ncbi:ankyrin repeat domain-containing protein 61-like [Pristis pectinata]|uniref:ankyrin repeat domain-containing protein 61-like n=1 Tax=Pristis pectinata TaxID=685728 RepID=UPI00223E4C60|nr:ankyrin repeat domain-containing protein 61-like [Pristis pectinata]
MCECQAEFNDLHAKLHDAIMRGDQETITSLLTVHPVNEPITIWKNCAMVPIYQNQVNPASLPKGLSILPIHLVATYRKARSLECLIQHKADLEAKDARGRRALHLILMHWPNTARDWIVPKTKFERAMAAMQSRAEACLRLLCRHGVEVNATAGTESRDTPLHLAVRHGAWPAVAVLARHGAELEATDQHGMTPLHMASGLLDRRVTEELLGRGARLDARVPGSGCTPLQLAVGAASGKAGRRLGAGLDCVRALLAAGAAVDARDWRGRSAAHEACFGGREEVVDLLLEHGANLGLCTELGESPLALFLERRPNLRRHRLLAKLLSLSCPPRIAGAGGSLPSGLLGPEFRCHREFLQALCRQPPALRDLCRAAVRRAHSRHQAQQLLPGPVWRFVYSHQDYAERLEEVVAGGPDERQEPEAQARLDNSLSSLYL